MKKSIVAALVVITVLAIGVPAALAITDAQKTELQDLYQQQHQLRQQIIDKQAEAGLIPAEDAAELKESMEERWKYRQQQMQEGNYEFGHRMMHRRGAGRSGRGCGNYL